MGQSLRLYRFEGTARTLNLSGELSQHVPLPVDSGSPVHPFRGAEIEVTGDLLRELHHNYVETYRGVARSAPGGRVEYCGRLTLVRTGLKEAPFNPVFALERPGSVETLPEQIHHLYETDETPWMLVTTPSTAPALAPVIEELHLQRILVLPGMVRPLPLEASPSIPRDLAVQYLTSSRELREAATHWPAEFGPIWEFFGGLLGTRESNPVALQGVGVYLGLVEGKPAATALRVTTHGVAGIYMVFTLEAFRHRGVGTALTWRAAQDSVEEGGSVTYLQASAMGRPLYEKLGYRAIEDYQIWVTSKTLQDHEKAEQGRHDP